MKKYPCKVTGTKDVYPRCTTIISDSSNKGGGLVQWSANETVQYIRDNCYKWDKVAYVVDEKDLNQARFNYKTISDEALSDGSETHDFVDKYAKTGKESESDRDEVNNAFGGFLDFVGDNNIVFNASEVRVYGPNWAGTLDLDWIINSVATITDVKTGKKLYPEARYQTAGYRDARTKQLIEQGASYVPEANGALRLDKATGEWEYKDYSKTYNQDLKVYNLMVDLYYARHPRVREKFNKHIKEVGK